MIIKGFKQHKGIKYDETFTPVTNMNTIRVVMPLDAQCKWP